MALLEVDLKENDFNVISRGWSQVMEVGSKEEDL
jgi:hypothetical protein